jgi:hypothetical protein
MTTTATATEAPPVHPALAHQPCRCDVPAAFCPRHHEDPETLLPPPPSTGARWPIEAAADIDPDGPAWS